MKLDIKDSHISVPIPTELYVTLLASLQLRGDKQNPAAAIASMLRAQLSHPISATTGETATLEVRKDWSDDWIAFQSPPHPAPVTKTTSIKKRNKVKHVDANDWCIGCACPSPNLFE